MSAPHTRPTPDAAPQTHADFDLLDLLDDALDDIRQRLPHTPRWEYAEGLLTALVCTRRAVPPAEWLPLLFDAPEAQIFANESERSRFLMAWAERESQLRAALQAPAEDFDPQALSPAVMDWRALWHDLPADERAALQAEGDTDELPALAELWALGFMSAVEHFEADWAPPRDGEIAELMADALHCVIDLLEADRHAPSISLSEDENAPPTISQARFDAFAEAIWAVYDLHAIAQSLGPRQPPARSARQAGRNDPCPCGSGRKYKKCCGA